MAGPPQKTAKTGNLPFAPVFVRGDLYVTEGNTQLEFIDQQVSAYGVTGLPWGPLKEEQYFGRKVRVKCRLRSSESGAQAWEFETDALISKEATLFSKLMGLKFMMEPKLKEALTRFVNQHGRFPTDYIRRYPRIPAAADISTFPLKAIVQTPEGSETMVFEVRNLSPNGALISTENPIAQRILAGERVGLLLDARGWFPWNIEADCLVCRVTDEIAPESGNMTRLLGLRFMKMEQTHREAFTALLRDILQQIQEKLAFQIGA